MPCETVDVGVLVLRAPYNDRVAPVVDEGDPAEEILAANAEPPALNLGWGPTGPETSGPLARA